ncbi:MAG TPA: AMP-binding protein [Marmoricola sp.]|nr:AMP-binding protein [Marmoricola sp.]
MTGTAAEILALLREWDAADDPAPLVIETSGSTGRAKRVVLSRRAMRASALATQARLGGPGQWVLNLPPTYVAGVQVLYRSVVAGTDPVVTSDVEAARAQVTGCSYLSLVPTQLHRRLGDPGAVAALAGFDAVLVGGGPLGRDTRRRAEEAGIAVVQTYGMSETCGGCVYDGRPLDGVEVRIEGGEVLLSGPVLFDGYEGDPERTAAVLRDGWFRTDDLGLVDGDGALHVTGRTDDMIISGAVKVPGPTVAERLRGLASVREAEVLGVPDEEWGERVVAFVVGHVGLDEVREHVAAELPREWAPRQVVEVAGIPLLANGKVDRVMLRSLA